MVVWKNQVVAGLVKGIGTLFKAWNVEHVEGAGSLEDVRTGRVASRDGTEQTIVADAIVIATSSFWPYLPHFPFDGTQIVTSQQLMDLTPLTLFMKQPWLCGLVQRWLE